MYLDTQYGSVFNLSYIRRFSDNMGVSQKRNDVSKLDGEKFFTKIVQLINFRNIAKF